jgi:hypothetical protein
MWIRDLGSTKDIPIEQGTYVRATAGTVPPTDPIAVAKQKQWVKGGQAPGIGEPIATGESLQDILGGRWEILDDGSAKYIADDLNPQEYEDVKQLWNSTTIITDAYGRKRMADRTVEDWIRGIREQVPKDRAERKALHGQENRLKGALSQLEKEQKFLDINLSASAKAKHEQAVKNLEVLYGDNFPRIKERVDRLVDFERRAILDTVRDTGLISDKVYDKIRALNAHHSPLAFLIDEWGDPFVAGQVGKSGKATKLLNKIKGSMQKGSEGIGLQKREIGYSEKLTYKDPIEELLRRTHNAVAFSERQNAANAVVRLLRKKKMGHKVPEPIAGINPTEESLMSILDNMDDFHAERVNSLPGGIQPENTIRFYDNGKVEYWRTHPDFVDAIGQLTPQELGPTMRVFAAYSHMLRVGATGTPEFALRNMPRDIMMQNILTPEGTLPWDWALSLAHMAGRTDVVQAFKRSGAGHATMSTLEADYGRVKKYGYDYLVQGKKPKVGGVEDMAQFFELVSTPARFIGQTSEMATRLGHFNRLRLMRESLTAPITNPKYWPSKLLKLKNDYQVGADKMLLAFKNNPGTRLQAAQDALREHKERDFNYISTMKSVRRGSIDFHMMGRRIRNYNRIRAFTNAGLQDPYLLAKAFQDRPFTTSSRITTNIVLPSAFFFHQNMDDPQYWKEPAWKRASFYYVGKTERGNWIRVPKPFLPGVIFGYGTEVVLEAMHQSDPDGTRSFLEKFLGSESFSDLVGEAANQGPLELAGGAHTIDALANRRMTGEIASGALAAAAPDLASTLLQGTGNLDAHRMAPIVPPHLKGASAPGEVQRGWHTSYTMGKLGEFMPESFSPMFNEWLTSEVLGGTGRSIVQGMDNLIDPSGMRAWKDDPLTLEDVGMIFGIVSRPATGFAAKPVQKFFERLGDLEAVHKTYVGLGGKGDKEDSRGRAFYLEHLGEIKAYDRARKTLDRLSTLADERAKIWEDESLKRVEKEKRLREKDRQIEEAVKLGQLVKIEEVLK